MKTFLFVALLTLTALSRAEDVADHKGVIAVGPAASESAVLWGEYNNLKYSAKSDLLSLEEGVYEGLTPSAVADKIERMAEIGTKLGRVDIAGWYYNNAAFAWISMFKSATYWEGMNLLNGKEKDKVVRKAKVRALQASSRANADLLSKAATMLEKARATGLTDTDFLRKLSSNRKFIEDVDKFNAQKF